MAFTVTSLAWGLLEFKDAYEAAGQLDYMYDCIRWPLEYLMKCHVAPHVFYGQVWYNLALPYVFIRIGTNEANPITCNRKK